MNDNGKEVVYPHNMVQIAPQGIVVIMVLGPGLTITTVLDEASANEMCKQWIASRKEVRRQIELVRNIENEHRHRLA